MLEALIQSPPIIRSQLVECMKVGGADCLLIVYPRVPPLTVYS